MVDVNAIGAGGGSIAWIDAAGSLRVGPALRRLGAWPRLLRPRRRAGDGDRRLDRPRLHRSGLFRRRLAEALAGARAPRRSRRRSRARSASSSSRPRSASIACSTRRWRRRSASSRSAAASIPRGYALVPLGGGGPLHATALARELGIRRIVVPPHPGVLSATGLLVAPDRARELPRPFRALLAGLEWPAVERALADRDQALRQADAQRGRARRADADPLLRRCLLRRAVLPPRNSASTDAAEPARDALPGLPGGA